MFFRGGLRVYYVIRGEGVFDFTQLITKGGGEGVQKHQKSYYVIYEQPLTVRKFSFFLIS